MNVPCSSTPAGPLRSATTALGVVFRYLDGVDSRDFPHFGAQSHGPRTRCLRFAGWITPPPRKTRFRRLANLTGRDWLPAGSHRKVSGLSHPPFPGFAWRTQIAVKTVRHLVVKVTRARQLFGGEAS